jgi:hypothetical protein
MSTLYNKFEEVRDRSKSQVARKLLGGLVQEEQYVGEVFSMSYEEALVLIHDYYRERVGGIPSLGFLIATRMSPDADEIDYKQEDTSVILLRVMDSAPLPDHEEAIRVRVQAAQRVTGEEAHWDEQDAMDASTHQKLSHAGLQCRVLGTFYLEDHDESPVAADEAGTSSNGIPLKLRFGSDISNFYPNRGLKVYKPNDEALAKIVNYRDPRYRDSDKGRRSVKIGSVRYASTNRSYQGVSNVNVTINPQDLIGNKTALFGMTRTGKSNTTKIMAKSVFEIRSDSNNPEEVGQVIFDPNGEYANENAQDNDDALKNVWRSVSGGDQNDVLTYGLTLHPDDPDRNIMKINFFSRENLQTGKEIIDSSLAGDNAKFIRNFRQVYFDEPEEEYGGERTRYERRVLAYRSLLAKAFGAPSSIRPDTSGLFNSALLTRMRDYEGDGAADFYTAASIFDKDNPSWGELHGAFASLHKFFQKDEYEDFERWYVENESSSGRRWAGEDLKNIVAMMYFPNGARQIAAVRQQHSEDETGDFADEIYDHLCDGNLVIVDQSSGDPEVNEEIAKRVMWTIFNGHKARFRQGQTEDEIPNILVYAEEAHNLLPSGSEDDLQDVWVRTAKEGAKYYLGLVYITQEVSSIQKNILKNTANWFIGHLNNTDETKELEKFYDFEDFGSSIRRAQDPGFLRVKTLSNPYVVPAQIDRFRLSSD